MRNYKSEEKYDISKFLNYDNGTYDCIDSPFITQLQSGAISCIQGQIAQLQSLPTVKYYNVNDGFKEIDLIAAQEYGDVFLAYLIQYYNNDFRETFPEGTILNLFSSADLQELYFTLSAKQNLESDK